MGKRIYRSTSVNVLDLEKLVEVVRDRRITFAIDVAKRDFKAVVMERPETVLATLSWQAPQDTRRLVEVVSAMAAVSQIEVALEPTGTYGDVVRALLRGLGLAVFRVSTKRSRDAAELGAEPTRREVRRDRGLAPWSGPERAVARGVRGAA
jgi:transposase